MIECKNGLFHLRNLSLSCLLRVNRYGLLEQVHFGVPVRSEDVEALAGQPGLGWGSSLLLNDKDPGSSPDAMALAWSGSGRGGGKPNFQQGRVNASRQEIEAFFSKS